MLINTLFLSKPLAESDYLSKSEGSDKMFGFLFSEIMNVDNQSEKLGLLQEHIGGNLIDYKSVFINYNFESNVILSTSQHKETKDPIISLSKLFLEDNPDNQKINEAEKIIYSPQQFVNSFTQLMKSLVENNTSSESVELKLFSKNFILSQYVDNTHINNVEKFLFETIESESSFSLTLSALGKQILFEVFSQVLPSILAKEIPDGHNANYVGAVDSSLENKSLSQIQSNKNNNVEETTTKNLFNLTEEKINLVSGEESLLLKGKSVEGELKVSQNNQSTEISNSDNINLDLPIDSQLKGNFKKVQSNDNTNSFLGEENLKEKINNRDSNSNISTEKVSIKNKDTEKSFNVLSTVNKPDHKSETELTDIQRTQNGSPNNIISRNENPTHINSGNPQIKIIIQSDSKNKVVSNAKINSDINSKISGVIENNQGQKKPIITARIENNSATQQNKIIDINKEQPFQDNLISDRQIQNLFRTISSSKQTIQREISSFVNVKSQQLNQQHTTVNLDDGSVQIITPNNSVKNISNDELAVKVNHSSKNELNTNSEIKKTKVVVPENSAQSNSIASNKVNVSNSVSELIVEKNSNIVLENGKKDFSININQVHRENNKVFTKDFTINNIDIPDNESHIVNNNSGNKNIVLNASLSSTEVRNEITNESPIKKIIFTEAKNPQFNSLNEQGYDLIVNDNKKIASDNSIELIDNEGNPTSNNNVKESQKNLKSELKPLSENTSEVKDNYLEEKVNSNSVNQDESLFIKKSKNNSSSGIVLDSNQSKTTDKLNRNSETKLNNSTNLQEEVSTITDVNLNKIQKDYSTANNVFRIVTEKPAKGIVGISTEFIQEEKSFNDTPKFNPETPKEVKVNEENAKVSIKEISHNETKADFSSQHEDSMKKSDKGNENIVNKENHFSNDNEESSVDIRNTIFGFEKKVPPASSRNNNEAPINSNKFDFNKFIESKSLESFVRTINDNNLNYRAELNNLFRNSNSVELRLYPEELGRVKILIDNPDNLVSVKIEVQSEQAKNLIISNLPQLRESLRQEGLNAQNLNVYLGSDEQKGQHSANQKRKNGNNKLMYDSEEKTEEVKIKNLGYNTIEYLA